jgi:hypothetical protein
MRERSAAAEEQKRVWLSVAAAAAAAHMYSCRPRSDVLAADGGQLTCRHNR